MKFGKIGLTCVSLFLLSALSITAFAQANGAGAAGGGGGRQGRGGQGGQRGQGRPVSIATIPVSTLSSYLKLTADQKTKIEAIQAQYKEAAKAFTSAPGAQVDQAARQEMRQKQQEATAKSEFDIKALLTDDQTKLLEPMNKELAVYQSVQIPAGVVGELKLTDAEHLKIMTIADESTKARTAKMAELQGGDRAAMQAAFAELTKSTHDKIMAVLTEGQKTILEAYLKEHPMNQFGGGGRRPGGGAGAAPPPPVH